MNNHKTDAPSQSPAACGLQGSVAFEGGNQDRTRINLALCVFTYPPAQNGVAIVAGQISQGLSSLGYNVTVLTSRQEGYPSAQKSERLTVRRFDSKGRGLFFNPYRGETNLYREVLISLRADVNLFLCWENWFVDIALEVFPQLTGKKIMASHGTSVYWRPPGPKGVLRRIAYQPLVRKYRSNLLNFDHIIFLSDRADPVRFYDRHLANTLGYAHCSTVPNGAPLAIGRANGDRFRRQHNLHGQFMVLYVANYTWSKNQLSLIRAFKRATIENSVLVLIGSAITPYWKVLMREAGQSIGKRQQILILSGLSDDQLCDAYAAADLFACPSRTEVQPLALLDAMASGLPFVSYDVGCIADLPGGITVHREDEMMNQLRALRYNPDVRSRLAQAGRAACSTLYNWDFTLSKYDSIIQSLLVARSDVSK